MNRILKFTLPLFLINSISIEANAEPYLGVNVGASLVTINKDITYADTTTNPSDKYSSFRGQLVLGYDFHSLSDYTLYKENNYNDGTVIEEFYFAVELDGSYNSNSVTTSVSPWFLTTTASVNEKQPYTFDLFVLPKYRLPQNIILFIGPGYSRGYFSVTTPSQTAGNLGVTGSQSSWLGGWSVKAGIEYPVSDGFNLLLTYQYSTYNNKTWSGIEPLTGDMVSAKYKPVVNSLTLGFNWRSL